MISKIGATRLVGTQDRQGYYSTKRVGEGGES